VSAKLVTAPQLAKEMSMEKQNQFSGWAVVELFGHSQEAGYVTTEYFGTACLFRVDIPEVEERQFALDRPEYIDGKLAPAGSVVKQPGVAGRTRLIGPGAVYAMNPGTEAAVRAVVEEKRYRPIALVKLAETPVIEASRDSTNDSDHDEDTELHGMPF